MNIFIDLNLEDFIKLKYLQIVDCFIDNIFRGNFKKGDCIFLINEFSKVYKCFRDMVEKGYKVLKEKRVIKIISGKGIYIDSIKLIVEINVFF